MNIKIIAIVFGVFLLVNIIACAVVLIRTQAGIESILDDEEKSRGEMKEKVKDLEKQREEIKFDIDSMLMVITYKEDILHNKLNNIERKQVIKTTSISDSSYNSILRNLLSR